MSDRKKDKPSAATEGLQAKELARTFATSILADGGDRVKQTNQSQEAAILARVYAYILSPEWGK